MSKQATWTIYEGERITVDMGWDAWKGHAFDAYGKIMDYYVVREKGLPTIRFKGETALSDVMRYAENREHMSNVYIFERAMSAKSLS